MVEEGHAVKFDYTSLAVAIPPDFLIADPPDARPMTIKPIDWANTAIPENAGLYATVLDHVLSPSECATLVALAEASVPPRAGARGASPWQPALVNIGGGLEVLNTRYRNSDRIIWDSQVIMDRLWARCARAPGLADALAVVVEPPSEPGALTGPRWEFERFNERGRYLRYGSGQYFLPHCDGAYTTEDKEAGEVLTTHYTVHLYLSDSWTEMEGAKARGGPGPDDLVGGATMFLSHDDNRRVNVDPKHGRVLIFQHDELYHGGDEVKQGIKLTMRTDIMYRLCRPT